MRPLHIATLDHREARRLTPTRASALALGALFVGTVFLAPAATAQTTSTVSTETSTTAVSTASTVPEVGDTTVVAESSEAAVEVTDTAVPEGGVDAGFGGTASDSGSVPVVPLALGAILVGGFATRRMAQARRAR